MADITLADADIMTSAPSNWKSVSGSLIAVKASTLLTTSYVATSWVPCDRWTRGSFVIIWTLGDETTIETALDTSEDGGTTAVIDTTIAAPSSGQSAVRPLNLQFTASQYTTTGVVRIDMDLSRVDRVRLRIKSTGGTPTGTYVIKFKGGRDI